MKLYIVDDDTDLIAYMSEFLEAAGYTVSSNNDSKAAAEEIAELKPDAVLLDLMMPGLDGLQLCKLLRENKELDDTKLIVITAKSYNFDRKRSLEAGADGYITKPLREETFVPQIKKIINDKMELTFWGVRGTLPVPGEKSIRYGGNTSCVTLEFARGAFFIFDAGSGIKSLSDWFMSQGNRKVDARIFLSHPHWDHINALPFFVPLYIQGNSFQVFGPSHGDITVHELISAQMDGVYFPITIHEFASSVTFHDLHEETLDFNGIAIKTMLLHHPGQCLGYRIEYKGRSICYITDNELFLESDEDHYDPFYVKRLTAFIEGADVLITDTTYMDEDYPSKVGWGHSCVSQVIDLADRAKVKELYLFHHDPDQNDDAIDNKLAVARKLLEERGSKVVCHAPAERTVVKV